jgi:CBS domain-containing protein
MSERAFEAGSLDPPSNEEGKRVLALPGDRGWRRRNELALPLSRSMGSSAGSRANERMEDPMEPLTSAGSVMTDSVLTVSPEATLLEVMRLFVEEEIHAAPVVGDDGQLMGVISTTDLLRAQEEEHDTVRTTTDYLRGLLEFSLPDWAEDLEDFQDRLRQCTVEEAMNRSFVSVPIDAPVALVARRLRENRIHRVWVEKEGRLCGVVSTLDLMPVIERATTK